MWTRESLIAHLNGGARPDFLFFWGHTSETVDAIDKACRSQWFACAFSDAGVHYRSAEHFMMAEKARLFRDDQALRRILDASTPDEAKTIGREVRGYDDAVWARVRSDAVVRGNLLKFGQHPELQAFLLGTNDRILVEASPRDRI